MRACTRLRVSTLAALLVCMGLPWMWWKKTDRCRGCRTSSTGSGDREISSERRKVQLALISVGAMPSAISNVPSMAKKEELALLYTLAKDVYEGDGCILEGGVFLGSSTLALGHGLLKNKRLKLIVEVFPRPIETFDRFVLSSFESMAASKAYPFAGLKQGSSSLQVYKENVKEVSHLQNLHVGDAIQELKGLLAPTGVEIAFLDFLKSVELNEAAVQYIFPKLLPGRSVVVQQDFQHDAEPWIHVTMGFFKEYFKFILAIPGGTVVYQYNKKIPEQLLHHFPSYHTAPLDSLLFYFDEGCRKVLPHMVPGYRQQVCKARSNLIQARCYLPCNSSVLGSTAPSDCRD